MRFLKMKDLMKMRSQPIKVSLALTTVLFAIVLSGACGFGGTFDQPKPDASPTPTPLSEFESELQSMRTVDFDFIFSFKRKDGEAFDSEDKKFLKDQTYIANRRSLLDDEKTILIGSNYEIEKKRLDALKERFDHKDFSKPAEKRKKKEEDSNSNVKDKKKTDTKNK